ncbi:NAD(P)H-binding protein [Halogeometricum sp. S1BR25-6]|uniref:NAD(P)H-binding protein n=1 Tax=Halogeometricum salsisoli TaxID=2950536 RepID=A0ABU2G942_9EURY|nr:NAD(P)H-binding protein [Halogeometricum sp. S1BR25-6]MDS0297331.1 NAD(P)H-binding protein [Halogeometricum sp. S1BR25-6]
MRVLVTGATGFVGGRLVPVLREAGHDVSVLVRDAESSDLPEGVGVVEGDLLEPRSYRVVEGGSNDGSEAGASDDPEAEPGGRTLADVLSALDIEAAYYLVHSMQSGDDFEERDRRAARNFERAASKAGVGRVVYLGGLGEDQDRLSSHLKSRREVELILGQGSFDLTTLRAAIVIGDGSAGFEVIRQLAGRLPVMVTPRWVDTECQPICVDDVVAYLVGVLDAPETAGRTFEIGGPDVLTYGEVLTRVGGLLGRRTKLLSVPVLTPRLSSYWVGFVTDVPPSVARPLIEGLKNPVVVRDDSIKEYVEVSLTPFDEAVKRALGEAEGSVSERTVPAADDAGGDEESGGDVDGSGGSNAGADEGPRADAATGTDLESSANPTDH